LTPGGYTILDTTDPQVAAGTVLDVLLTGGELIGYSTYLGKQTVSTDPAVQQAVLNAQALIGSSFVCGGSVTTNCYAGAGTPSNPENGAFNQQGSVAVTSYAISSFVYQDTPVNQRLDQYSTTLLVTLNGTQTILNQTFDLPFSDPAVQLALQQAQAALAASLATFGSPILTSSSTTLQNSQNSTVVTGSVLDGKQTVTTETTFGPAIVDVSNDADPPTAYSSGSPAWVYVLPNQSNINIVIDNEYLMSRNLVTTDTYLTSQTYDLNGLAGSSSSSVPEPASAGLLAAGLLSLAIIRAKRRS
jgi:hypothetical protein